jgi:hypothetical protein
MRNYPPNPAVYHEEVALPDDGDNRGTAATFGPGYEGALDNAAFAKVAAEAAAQAVDDLINIGFPYPQWVKLADGVGDDEGLKRELQFWQAFVFCNSLDSTYGGPGDHWLDGFDAGGPGNYGSIVGPANTRAVYIPIQKPLDGSELVDIKFWFRPPDTHTALPTSLPTFELMRSSNILGSAPETIATATAAPDDVDDWNGGDRSLTLACSHVVTLGRHYFLRITDEHGSNSLAGSRYWGATLRWSVTELRP